MTGTRLRTQWRRVALTLGLLLVIGEEVVTRGR
jgi:hypothetical protein